MRKHLILATAMLTLAGAPAFAQTTMTPAPSEPKPAEPSTAPAAPGPKAGVGHMSEQGASQWMASKVIGASVVGPDGKTVGDINDIVLEQSGSAQAAVIGVGGFLGVGEKRVAVPFSQLQVARDGNGEIDKITLGMTKDELNNAPTFQTMAEKNAATRSAAKPDSSGMTTGSTRPAQ
ncbi:PRC-barrel domain-containing protein [Chelatococcus reniformis]|uniref:PRC-barrel domain-containing protein n=1 Tax=Chelatococcus reniformis TaxID=1494448 RepID=A0A916U1H3_9HYPH|nr:PRC-barrel domain-containing protein [Chelatococcus reniformis]GGC54887.1 hypothetical protein GCM10010994_12260 [Chelatococcus reniformis]